MPKAIPLESRGLPLGVSRLQPRASEGLLVYKDRMTPLNDGLHWPHIGKNPAAPEAT